MSGQIHIRVFVSALLLCAMLGAVKAGAQSIETYDQQDRIGQRFAGWRSAWQFRLTTIPADPVIPDTVIVTIKNLSSDTLRGCHPFFHLYEVDAYEAVDTISSVSEFALAPDDSITFRASFQSLKMVGYRHLPTVDTSELFDVMRTKPWSMRAGFADMYSPKPLWESSHVVYSNLIECNRHSSSNPVQ